MSLSEPKTSVRSPFRQAGQGMSTTCPGSWDGRAAGKCCRSPPLKLYEAAKLMDSFEKPNILAGIQTTADAIKSGQKEYGSAEERQTAQQPDEHKAVMRLFGALAKALNAGYKFGERGSLEWRLVAGVARQHGWVGEDKEALQVLKMLDLLNTSYRVRREKLLAQFRPRAKPSETPT